MYEPGFELKPPAWWQVSSPRTTEANQLCQTRSSLGQWVSQFVWGFACRAGDLSEGYSKAKISSKLGDPVSNLDPGKIFFSLDNIITVYF